MLTWSLDGGDILLGQRLAGALLMFWNRHYHFTDWEWWVPRALEHTTGTPPAVRAKLLFSLGECTYFQQVPLAGIAPLREAVALYRQLGDQRGLGWALVVLGLVLGFADTHNYTEAIALSQQGLAIFRERNDLPAVSQGLNVLGELTRVHGDDQQARAAYEESLMIAMETGDKLREQMLLDNLGFVAYRAGQYEQAEAYFRQGLALAKEADVKAMAVSTLAFLGGAVGARGDAARGVRLLAASEALQRSMVFVQQPADQDEVDRYQAHLRAALSEDAFRAAWQEGIDLAAKGLEEVVRYVEE